MIADCYNASYVLFRNLPAGRGDKVAVHCGDERVTYAALADSAARIGNALLDLGLESGDRVALLLLDTPVLPEAFLGAIRAGLIPIPLNTVLPSDNYEFFLKDSGARAMIVDGPLHPAVAPVLGECAGLEHVIVTGGDMPAGSLAWDDVVTAAASHLDPAPTAPTDPAFWLYSSGSTGFPKGVVHLQKDIPYTVDTYARQVLGIEKDDVTFSASKAFHAYGLGNNITFPYSVGASTVLFPGRPTPASVFEQIRRFRPTLFFTAPTLYAAMLASDEASAADLSSIRLCVSAAEALPPEIGEQWRARFGLEILDGIGSTEMLHIFISNRPGSVKPGSSGTAVPGYEVQIVDEEGEPVPVGKSGDLVVRGGSAAPYYWNRPERTAVTMRGDWVYTGDRYHRDTEGFFFYEGRSDDMFKVSGQWVSPIEVENALLEHETVFECAVVPFKDGADLVKPGAWIVLHQGFRGNSELAEELQRHVKTRLAPYKYPRSIEFVAELPKTATGKIQRFRLRAPDERE